MFLLQIILNNDCSEQNVMFVCLCNGIKDTELRDLARNGVRKAEDAYREIGVEMHCEDCSEYVQAVIDESITDHA